MGVALPFFLFLHSPHTFRGQFIHPPLATLLDIVKEVYHGYLKIGKSHFFIIFLGRYSRFSGPLEEVHAGLSLDTLSLSPWDLLTLYQEMGMLLGEGLVPRT